MAADIYLKEKHLSEFKAVVRSVCPAAVIWAYGSRVNGDFYEGSDLDIVIKDYGKNDSCYCELKESFNESCLPFIVDLFEFDRLPESFQNNILNNHIVIYDGVRETETTR